MERRQFLAAGAATVGVVVMPGANRHGRRVNEHDIAAIGDLTDRLRHLDFSVGGVVARQGAMVQLVQAGQLFKADCPDRLRPALHRAVGDLAQNVGFSAHDAGQWDEASQAWRFGLAAVEGTGHDDWNLWSQLMGCIARQEIWLGRPEVGVAQIDQALDACEQHVTASTAAMLWAVKSRGYARMGQAHQTLCCAGHADDYMARVDPDVEAEHAPWMLDIYDGAIHSGNVAHALVDLVVAGHKRLAPVAGRRQIEQMLGAPPERGRSQLFASILGATVVMAAGDPDQAVQLGHQAVDATAAVRSVRAATMLGQLHEVAARHADRDDVAEVRQRIAVAT